MDEARVYQEKKRKNSWSLTERSQPAIPPDYLGRQNKVELIHSGAIAVQKHGQSSFRLSMNPSSFGVRLDSLNQFSSNCRDSAMKKEGGKNAA